MILCALLNYHGVNPQYDRTYQIKSKTPTPASMNGLFSDLFRELLRGILGVIGTVYGRVWEVSSGEIQEHKKEIVRNNIQDTSRQIQK